MFIRNDNNKKLIILRIADYFKKARGIQVSNQSAERIEYILSLRYLQVDSIEISGTEVNSGRSLNVLIPMSEIIQHLSYSNS
jgi:rare lipoprotein A (peptidoglycan hydrolase)